MQAPPPVQVSFSPGVSVVIPAYNYARYLPKAIDSILAQDYTHYEIIVVDDGSTDNTREVVERYGPRVRYIYQKNAGLPAARNTGIRAARFAYIGFLDADDEWLPTLLRRLMEVFEKLPSEYAISACPVGYIDSEGRKIFSKKSLSRTDRMVTCRDIILTTRFTSSSVVVKREAFEKCGFFDESLRSSEDRDMWIRITAKYNAYLISERLASVRRHPSNMSKHADRMKANVRKVIGKAYTSELVPHSDRLFWLRVFSFYFFQNAWRYRDERRHALALRELLFSLALWPFFPAPENLNQPGLFRLRSFVQFSRELAFRSS